MSVMHCLDTECPAGLLGMCVISVSRNILPVLLHIALVSVNTAKVGVLLFGLNSIYFKVFCCAQATPRQQCCTIPA